jgi:hypothetical protein
LSVPSAPDALRWKSCVGWCERMLIVEPEADEVGLSTSVVPRFTETWSITSESSSSPE